MKNMNMLFVLGAADPEMNRIEAALASLGIKAEYASKEGVRIHPGKAYESEIPVHTPDLRIVTVECGFEKETQVFAAIDHHRPGDAGFGKKPDQFWQGSSIGQTYILLEENGFTAEELDEAFGPDRFLIAASDHCPSHAFAGMCQGIDVVALKAMRLEGAAAYAKLSVEEFTRVVDASIERLLKLPTAVLSGIPYHIAEEEIPFLNHAQLIAGKAVEYRMAGSARDPRTKIGILGGTDPELIRAWMAYKTGTLVGIYGDPERGYAGGYMPE